MNRMEIGGYKRISKKQAEELFNEKKNFRIVPCKYRPDNIYIYIDINSSEVIENGTFEQFINSWLFYNARYETGYYPAFYIKA